MTTAQFADSSRIRYDFSIAMSKMYQTEVPLYTDLIDLVNDINKDVMDNNPDIKAQLERTGEIERLDVERHGAIRLGTKQELSMMRRLFAVMGMYPVGYYDLTVANVPVHSTAFRAIDTEALNQSPFRVFTSLLRLDLIEDKDLRAKAEEALHSRNIFTDRAIELIETFEANGGLTEAQSKEFIDEALETFRWHDTSPITKQMYDDLLNEHRLIADIVGFKGPHINHLTPRTLDIDAAQQGMADRNIPSKDIIEGPPRRRCPILLRQTSFKALEEPVNFQGGADGTVEAGEHTARFGEIEQRGVALTPKGRALYDDLLIKARSELGETPNKSNADKYYAILEKTFRAFPDDYQRLHDEELAYFYYYPTDSYMNNPSSYLSNLSSILTSTHSSSYSAEDMHAEDIKALIEQGIITIEPIIYEDFLPVSAAGIFQSNLTKDDQKSKNAKSQNNQNQDSHVQDGHLDAHSNQKDFEQDLGASVYDELSLYADSQEKSLNACLQVLKANAEL